MPYSDDVASVIIIYNGNKIFAVDPILSGLKNLILSIPAASFIGNAKLERKLLEKELAAFDSLIARKKYSKAVAVLGAMKVEILFLTRKFGPPMTTHTKSEVLAAIQDSIDQLKSRSKAAKK
jgi:hypothetical protein